MTKNKNLNNEKKKKVPFNVLSKKGLIGLAMAGVMIASPFMLAGCSSGQDGKDGADGTVWKSGTSYTQFTDAKVGDYFIDTDDYQLWQKTADSWSIVMENYGRPGTTANDIEMQVASGNIQWRYKTGSDTEWKNLLAVSTLTGEPGKEIELQTTADYIQWKYTDNAEWNNLIPLSSLKGTDGSTWISGEVAPTTEGNNGDFYLNESTYDIYKKTDGTWNKIGNIKGSSYSEVTQEKVVDLVIFMGQSNMAGRGDYTQATEVPQGQGYEFRAVSDPTKLYDIGSQAFGVNENNGVITETSKTGSMVPALMKSYYDYTGVPMVGVSASKGGTSINWWQPNGDALNEAISRYTSAKNYLTENDYTIRHQYMVWCQGETDGDNAMDKETYKTQLSNMISEMHNQGIEQTMIVRIGNHRDNATLYDDIILAQTELCAEKEDVVMISGKLAEMAEDGLMKDVFHYTQEGYNIAGNDAGKNMAYFVNNGMEPYYYDSEYDNYYPFGNTNSSSDDGSSSGSNDETGDDASGETGEDSGTTETVESFVVNVSENTHDLSSLGTVDGDKLTISSGSKTNGFTLDEKVVLSDDYDWTLEFVAQPVSNNNNAMVIAHAGVNGYSFISIPYAAGGSSSSCQFRFRNSDKSLQIEFVIPSNYDTTVAHHFAITFDSSTKTFKAYLDKAELTNSYSFGAKGDSFEDIAITTILGGYPVMDDQNFCGDFYYFAYHNEVLETTEMYTEQSN